MFSESIRQVRVVISGSVQGVGYRAWTKHQAVVLGLSGWVMNCPDGSVQALLCGESSSVDEMIMRMKLGPRFAEVQSVSVTEEEAHGQYTDFTIR